MPSELRITLLLIIAILVPTLAVRFWERMEGPRWALITAYTGAMCNFLVMLFNGEQMPVIGVSYIPQGETWKVADSSMRLAWLVDRFQCSLGTYSVGDVLLFFGAVIWIPAFFKFWYKEALRWNKR